MAHFYWRAIDDNVKFRTVYCTARTLGLPEQRLKAMAATEAPTTEDIRDGWARIDKGLAMIRQGVAMLEQGLMMVGEDAAREMRELEDTTIATTNDPTQPDDDSDDTATVSATATATPDGSSVAGSDDLADGHNADESKDADESEEVAAIATHRPATDLEPQDSAAHAPENSDLVITDLQRAVELPTGPAGTEDFCNLPAETQQA